MVPVEELPPDEVGPGPEPLPLPDAVVPTATTAVSLAIGNRAARRWIYTRLALVRKALRVWEQLRTVLADPREPFDHPARALMLLEAVGDVRALLPQLRGLLGARGGGVVLAVVSQPSLFDTLRSLLPEQRQALAIDWRRGQVELQREYRRLRGLSRAGREPRTGPTGRQVLTRWISETPELILVLLAVVAVFIALFRGASER
jgi:hypothetical protein